MLRRLACPTASLWRLSGRQAHVTARPLPGSVFGCNRAPLLLGQTVARRSASTHGKAIGALGASTSVALLAGFIMPMKAGSKGVIGRFRSPVDYEQLREEMEAHLAVHDARHTPKEEHWLLRWLKTAGRILIAAAGCYVGYSGWQLLEAMGGDAADGVVAKEASAAAVRAYLRLVGGVAAATWAALWQAKCWAYDAMGWSALEARRDRFGERRLWVDAKLLPSLQPQLAEIVETALKNNVRFLEEGSMRVVPLRAIRVELYEGRMHVRIPVALEHDVVDNGTYTGHLRVLNERMLTPDEEERGMLLAPLLAAARETVSLFNFFVAHYNGVDDDWDYVDVVLEPSKRSGCSTVTVETASAAMANPLDLADRLILAAVRSFQASPAMVGTVLADKTREDAATLESADDFARSYFQHFLMRCRYGKRMPASRVVLLMDPMNAGHLDS